MALAALALAGLIAIPAVAGAEDEGTDLLRVAFPSEDGSLTPYTFTNGYELMTLVYDTLTWRDAEGVARPWLAQSVRRDGRTVRVRLRRGVRWHDGRPLTAEDVVFTYRYMAERRHPRFTLQLRDIASVTAADARTVVFSLRRASLGFADQPLADVPILPRHIWAGLPPGRDAPPGLPVGSGPFRLVAHRVGTSYTFRANRTYFMGPPRVRTLEVPIVTREQEAFRRLTAAVPDRRIDLVPVTVPAGSTPDRNRRVVFDEGVSYNGTMLAFNVGRPPFDRLAARRAVSDALDLERIAGAVSGAGAMAPADRGAVHPRSPWAPGRDLRRPDRAASRLAFAEEGIAPFDVLASTQDAVRLEAARRVVRDLSRLGAPARLVRLSPDALQRALGRGGAQPTFQAAVVVLPALASYDPAYLRNVFGDPSAAALNDFGYRSARFERLDDRVSAATSRSERRRAVAAELEHLAADLPALPLFFGGTTFAYRRGGYPGWVSVRGSGVLDKRSFLASDSTASADPPVERDPFDTAEDTGGGSLVPYIVGLAVLLLAGALLWDRRSRSQGTRTRAGRRR
jgi:peptide/nickel transport system substrate-binding protein